MTVPKTVVLPITPWGNVDTPALPFETTTIGSWHRDDVQLRANGL